MLFKIETVVVFTICILLQSVPAYSATTERASLDPATAAEFRQKIRELDCDGEGRKENRAACLRYESGLGMGGSSSSTTGEACREAEDKFNQAAGKFSGTCGTAGLDLDNASEEGKTGAIGCSWTKNRCQCLNKKIESDASTKYRCEDFNKGGSSDRIALSAQSSGLIDIKQARKRIEACPHEDPDDTERYEKQLEKAQERVKEAKKKMPELMNKGSEAQDKAAEKQNEASRKGAELQKEFAKEVSEIRKKKSGEEQQAVTEMGQKRAEMDKVDAQIRQYELNKLDAEVKLSETKTTLELQCHATASQQVAGRQTVKMAAIRKGQPQGDFNKLMNSVGVSSRAAWEKVAEVYYKRCVNSRPTRDSKKAAQNIYDSTLRSIESAISTARGERRRMEEGIKEIMTTNGCAAPAAQPGQVSGETRMCRSAREANEEMVQAQQNMQVQQQQLLSEQMIAQRQLATKNQALGTEYADAQQELNDENKRIENLRNYLNLKREKSNGVGGKEAAKNMNEAYGALEAAANQIVSCRRKDEDEGITPEGYQKAFDFLESIDQKPVGVPREFTRRVRGQRPGGARPEIATPRQGGTPAETVRETTTPQ